MPRRQLLLVPIVALSALSACRTEGSSTALAGVGTETPAGLATLAYGDFGALSRDGLDRATVPWKLVAVGLMLRAERAGGHPLTLDSLPALLQRYGFLDATRIKNWSGPLPREHGPAVGMVTGQIPLGFPGLSVTGAVIGCAACHSGVLYDREGVATGEAWVGLPTSSLALDAYTAEVFAGLRLATADRDATVARIRREFPATGFWERFTLKRLIIPRTRDRVAEMTARQGGALPFLSGPPGHTNGLAALKYFLRPDRDGIDWSAEVGFTAIPDFTARHLRSAMFVDAVYVPRGGARGVARSGAADPNDPYLDSLAPIVAIVAVPALGVTPDRGVREIGRARGILSWLTTYRTPPFPGEVDATLAAAGGALFTQHCADCHGEYGDPGDPVARPQVIRRYPNRLVPLDRIGTDPQRLLLADSVTGEYLRRSAFGPYLEASSGVGYLPPTLNGLWATAPYLHNGSVPTVWDLLSPDERPERFVVGGHRLDYTRLGIALVPSDARTRSYPSGHVPWSHSAEYDVSKPGYSNRGHRFPRAGLSADEKRQLIEYLKTL